MKKARPKIVTRSQSRSKPGVIKPRAVRPRGAKPVVSTKTKKQTFLNAFEALWKDLWTSPVHLDSALSKQKPTVKALLAQTLPAILARPSSLAEALGVGVAPGEPWSLDRAKLAVWRPASQMADRLFGRLSAEKPEGFPPAFPTLDDFPPSLLEDWRSMVGEKAVAHLVTVLASEAPLTLRVYRKSEREDLLQRLRKLDLVPKQSAVTKLSPVGLELARYSPVLSTQAFEKGEFEIQDEGSQLMAWFALWPEQFGILSPVPGVEPGATVPRVLPEAPGAWTVIDACAGAGGKSLAFADALKNRGRVYAYDTSERKLQSLRRRAIRAGFNNIQSVTVKEGEESQLTGKFRSRANLVLVDAPCSGWGVLRRNPDIKWRQGPEALANLPILQKRLLAAYAELVAPGGRLVYGVCTFRKTETTEVVDAFLKDHPNFEKESGGYLGPAHYDGFFMQAFRKAGKSP